MKTIKRDLYLDQLINKMSNGLIKIITGIRRSGKSYLLFNIFKNGTLDKIEASTTKNRQSPNPKKLDEHKNTPTI